MKSTDQLIQVFRLAAEAYSGQVEKLGNPYVEHRRRVVSAIAEQKIVAYLRDVLEKGTGCSIDCRVLWLPTSDAYRRRCPHKKQR
ncbi:hypothetical protein [Rhizobium sp. RCC_161_2]|uniref:hypothetical protein n=1 Tax=Rhizobium sp. RCC_161_2 TaxID=3239219 RepID=UPI003523F4F2